MKQDADLGRAWVQQVTDLQCLVLSGLCADRDHPAPLKPGRRLHMAMGQGRSSVNQHAPVFAACDCTQYAAACGASNQLPPRARCSLSRLVWALCQRAALHLQAPLAHELGFLPRGNSTIWSYMEFCNTCRRSMPLFVPVEPLVSCSAEVTQPAAISCWGRQKSWVFLLDAAVMRLHGRLLLQGCSCKLGGAQVVLLLCNLRASVAGCSRPAQGTCPAHPGNACASHAHNSPQTCPAGGAPATPL